MRKPECLRRCPTRPAYDAFTINPILFLEDLGFPAQGGGGAVRRQRRDCAWWIAAINTNGGGLSCVHPDNVRPVRPGRGRFGNCGAIRQTPSRAPKWRSSCQMAETCRAGARNPGPSGLTGHKQLAQALYCRGVRTAGGAGAEERQGLASADLGGESHQRCAGPQRYRSSVVETHRRCVSQIGGESFHIARHMVLASRLPKAWPAVSIDRQCAVRSNRSTSRASRDEWHAGRGHRAGSRA